MSSTAAVRRRYTSVATTIRRARELDLGSAALVLAAQQLMCTIPLLVVLSAIHPASASANFGAQLARYLRSLGARNRRAERAGASPCPADAQLAAGGVGRHRQQVHILRRRPRTGWP